VTDPSLNIEELIKENSFLKQKIKELEGSDHNPGLGSGLLSEEHYRILTYNVPDIIYSLDGKGNIVNVNSPSFNRYGYDEQDAKGQPFLDFVHPEDRKVVIGSFLKALEEKRKVTTGLQFRILSKNGSSYWFELNAQARFDIHGCYCGEDGVLRDISERKQAEEKLRNAERMLRLIFDSTPVMIWQKDQEGRYLQVNNAYCETVGLTEEAILGKTDYDLYPKEIADKYANHDRQILSSGQAELGIEERHKKPFGEDGWSNTDKFIYCDNQENIAGTIGFALDITNRKCMEEDLKLYKLIIERSSEAIAISDQQGQLIYINPAHEKLFGRSLAKAKHLNYRDYYPSESIHILNNEVVPALESGQSWEGELDVFDAAGRKFSLWEKADAILDNDGRLMYGFGFMHDITEQKVMKKLAQERETQYCSLFEAIEDAIFVIDRDTGRIIDVNPGATRMYGFTHSEFLMMTAGDVSAEPEKTAEAMKEVVPFIPLRYHHRRDGSVFPVELTASAFDLRGRNTIIAAAREITERLRITEALRKSEQRLDLAMKATQDAVWDWDLVANTIYYSPRWWSMVGYEENELDATPDLWRRLIHPEDLERANRIVEEAISKGPSFDMEMGLLHKDGHYLPVLTRGLILHDDSGKAVRISGTNTDITERNKIEEDRKHWEKQHQQLQKAESLSRMAAAIAHHFNNKLGAVIGNLEMAIDGLPLGAEPAQSLNEAMKAAENAAEMSALMLTYLGQTPSKRDIIDLSEVCRLSLHNLQAVMPAEIGLETDFPSSGPMIKANVVQIQQVLTNLTTNSWEAFGGDRGTIQIKLGTVSTANIPTVHHYPVDWTPKGDVYACLELIDAGCGIEDKDIEKIFDPFFTTKFTGRGLGLAVVMGIVKAHSGVIAVDSMLGKGSSIRIFLPLAAVEVDSPPKVNLGQTLEIKEAGTVLLVEDDESLRNTVKRMLMRLGFAVLEAGNGVEALDVFRKHQDEIRCVLTDLTMPSMNGWETLAALRTLSPNIPVILASGYDEAQVMVGDHAKLPQAFLGKPYNLKGLRNAIDQVLADRT